LFEERGNTVKQKTIELEDLNAVIEIFGTHGIGFGNHHSEIIIAIKVKYDKTESEMQFFHDSIKVFYGSHEMTRKLIHGHNSFYQKIENNSYHNEDFYYYNFDPKQNMANVGSRKIKIALDKFIKVDGNFLKIDSVYAQDPMIQTNK